MLKEFSFFICLQNAWKIVGKTFLFFFMDWKCFDVLCSCFIVSRIVRAINNPHFWRLYVFYPTKKKTFPIFFILLIFGIFWGSERSNKKVDNKKKNYDEKCLLFYCILCVFAFSRQDNLLWLQKIKKIKHKNSLIFLKT